MNLLCYLEFQILKGFWLRLAEYPIPKRFEDLYFDEDPTALLDNFPFLGEELSFANYKDKFANLLYLEEMEQTEQMTQFR